MLRSIGPRGFGIARLRRFLAFCILVLPAATGFLSVTARATERAKPRIGYLMERAGPTEFDQAFLQGLREHGYVDGQNITIEYRWADDHADRLRSLADQLVSVPVDLIVTAGTPAVKAAKEATTTIPIVMASSQNAVGDGLIESLAHPGGNVTGRSVYAPELTPKRLELLKETVPNLSRVAVLWNVRNPGNAAQFREAQAAARILGLEVDSLDVRIPDDLEPGTARVAAKGVRAILILSDSATITHREQIAAAASRHRLPTMFANKAYLRGGGVMSYGPDIVESFRLTAVHVDKILKGATPAELPVEQPVKFEFAINIKAAETLGLAIPPALLARADEIME